MKVNDAVVVRTLELLGEALSSGKLAGVAECWETPALILTDQGAISLTSSDGILEIFSKAVDWYRNQGLMSTKPEIERIEMLNEAWAQADVRWPAFDQAGHEKASERSRYVLHVGSDGRARIQVALTRTTRTTDPAA